MRQRAEFELSLRKMIMRTLVRRDDGDGDYKDDNDDDNKSRKRLHHKQAALHRRVPPHFSHTKPLLTRPL